MAIAERDVVLTRMGNSPDYGLRANRNPVVSTDRKTLRPHN
jgi:hypothetical protein